MDKDHRNIVFNTLLEIAQKMAPNEFSEIEIKPETGEAFIYTITKGGGRKLYRRIQIEEIKVMA